jgi:hypothetical protein
MLIAGTDAGTYEYILILYNILPIPYYLQVIASLLIFIGTFLEALTRADPVFMLIK